MPRLTSRIISNAINARFNVPGIMVSCMAGVCHFYSDTNEEAGSKLAMSDCATVYVCCINHLTLEQWLEAFAAAYGVPYLKWG